MFRGHSQIAASPHSWIACAGAMGASSDQSAITTPRRIGCPRFAFELEKRGIAARRETRGENVNYSPMENYY